MAAVSSIRTLFENIIFLSTALSLCAAQLTKMFILLLGSNRKIITNRKNIREIIETAIWRTGGMPSSHSAVVCSLTTSVGITEGLSSNLFVFCLVFSMVVLRDALGVRRASGLQAKALNDLGKQTAEKIGIDFNVVKEIQGHTPLEVLVGALLGILIAIGFALFL
jgi:acid phosphatase family membrane protein YuiD